MSLLSDTNVSYVQAVINNMKVTCKCHGLSGSCSLITCWQQLAPFRKVGDYLRDKYEDATRVKPTRGGRLRLHRRNVKIPTANDLVFIKESPDYCHHNSTTGSLGENWVLKLKIVASADNGVGEVLNS